MAEAYRVDIKSPDRGLLKQYETRTPSASAAVAAFRHLLATTPPGPGCAARLVRMSADGQSNRSVYYSLYDGVLGKTRIHPSAPLMAGLLDPLQSERAARWTPLEEGTGELLTLVREALDRGENALVETQAEYVAGVLLASVLSDGFEEVRRRVSGLGEGYSVEDDKMLKLAMSTLNVALKDAGFSVG